MRYEIKELGLGGILDQAVAIIKDNFGLLFVISLVLYAPYMIVEGYLNVYFLEQFMDAEPQTEPGEFDGNVSIDFSPLFWMYAVTLIGVLTILPLTNAAVVHAISRIYLGQAVTVGSSFRYAFSIFLPLIWTWFFMYFIIAIGFMLLVIPGILFSIWYAISTQVAVIEKRWGWQAMKRSKALVRAQPNTFVMLLVMLFVINLCIGVGAGYIPEANAQVIVSALIQSFSVMFGSAVLVVYYFSARCKHEHFDLDVLAQVLETAPAPAAEAEPGDVWRS